jgi:transposase
MVLRKRLTRAKVLTFFANLPRCVIGLEACGGAHYWARELIRLGHDARLMPPQYVKAYVKTNKHDAADAEACCEAVQRPSMRFVPVKTEAQQASLMLHRVRDQLIGQRTASINALRGHLAELGIVGAQRQAGLRQLMMALGEIEDERIAPPAREMLQLLALQIRELEAQIAGLDRRLVAMTRTDPICRSLAEVPGSPGTQDRPLWSVRSGEGPVIATAFLATVPEANVFRSGRHLAAWLGLVRSQHATAGKERRLGISKRGDGYLRRQLIHGARALVRISHGRTGKLWSWIGGLRARRPFNVVVVGGQPAGADALGDAEPRRGLPGRVISLSI